MPARGSAFAAGTERVRRNSCSPSHWSVVRQPPERPTRRPLAAPPPNSCLHSWLFRFPGNSFRGVPQHSREHRMRRPRPLTISAKSIAHRSRNAAPDQPHPGGMHGISRGPVAPGNAANAKRIPEGCMVLAGGRWPPETRRQISRIPEGCMEMAKCHTGWTWRVRPMRTGLHASLPGRVDNGDPDPGATGPRLISKGPPGPRHSTSGRTQRVAMRATHRCRADMFPGPTHPESMAERSRWPPEIAARSAASRRDAWY